MLRSTLLGAVGAMALTTAASAAPIALDTLYGFSFNGAGTAIEGTATSGFINPSNPSGLASPDAPWTFTITAGTTATLTVLDLFISGDEFEIFNFGVSLGTTSAAASGGSCGSNFTCALADSRYSRGIFSLAAGDYSISGTQLTGTAGAGGFIVEVAAVPIPATGALLLVALGGAGLAGRRRRS